jgi:ATP-binding cassette subfamily B protein
LVDGQDLRDVTLASLRSAVAIVSQDVTLFDDTIRANIALGRLDATHDEIVSAAKAAAAHDFIMAQKQGYDTMIGDGGARLSGGQRQRLALARAILKDAPILLLDEATAALDGESEEAIREALLRLMRGRTVIAIAHRLATLRNFDRVVVLQGGRIIEDGPPDILVQGRGPYRELVAREVGRLASHAAA